MYLSKKLIRQVGNFLELNKARSALFLDALAVAEILEALAAFWKQVREL